MGWWPLPDLNQRPIDYESTALTAELRGPNSLIAQQRRSRRQGLEGSCRNASGSAAEFLMSKATR